MELIKVHNDEIIFGQDWSLAGVEQSYNTQSEHKIIKIALSKSEMETVIEFSVENISLLDFPMDPFGIIEIVITFKQNSTSGKIHLECHEALESTTINFCDIKIT